MADNGDLKTQQFAQVLSAVPTGVPVGLRCRRFVGSLVQSPLLRALFVGLGALFILLLVRPPFVLSFEYDKTRPWKGRSYLSWLSVFAVALLAAAAAAGVPWVC
jgi:hypothetical protein